MSPIVVEVLGSGPLHERVHPHAVGVEGDQTEAGQVVGGVLARRHRRTQVGGGRLRAHDVDGHAVGVEDGQQLQQGSAHARGRERSAASIERDHVAAAVAR